MWIVREIITGRGISERAKKMMDQEMECEEMVIFP